MIDIRKVARDLEAKARQSEWVETVEILINDMDDGWHVQVALQGRGAENANAALIWASEAMLSLTDGRESLIRILPEIEVQKNFARAEFEVKSYARFFVIDRPGDVKVMRYERISKSLLGAL